MEPGRLRKPAIGAAAKPDRIIPGLVGIVGLVGRLVIDIGVGILLELPFMRVVAAPLQHQDARLAVLREGMQEEGRSETGTDDDEIEMLVGDLLGFDVKHHQILPFLRHAPPHGVFVVRPGPTPRSAVFRCRA